MQIILSPTGRNKRPLSRELDYTDDDLHPDHQMSP